MRSERKIGFWPVFALVLGSQIGSGVLMSPAYLAPYGWYGILGWGLAGLGAVSLALVFSGLCRRFPKTGGPHAYVAAAFGPTTAFFVGWAYWVISWISTTTVIAASISYLTPLIGRHSAGTYVLLELGLLGAITLLNLRGLQAAGRAEFLFSLLKCLPLIVIPAMALALFKPDHFVLSKNVASQEVTGVLGHVTLLAFWCFIGIEAATTPAGSIENPRKTIPRAITLGTFCVALFYLFNSIGIMGAIPGDVLAQSASPYADAAQKVLGGNWHLAVSLVASIVCIGTLNAWILTSGQIALGLAQDGLLPRFFSKKNRYGAPYVSIIISSLGLVPLVLLTGNDSLATQVTLIVDVSVVAFLFVYLTCALAFLKLLIREKAYGWTLLNCLFSMLFCACVLYKTSPTTLLQAALFTVSAIPMYVFWYRKRQRPRGASSPWIP